MLADLFHGLSNREIFTAAKASALKRKEPPSIVKNVMTKPVITIDKGSSVLEAARIMSEKRIGCIVVTDEGKTVGIATERDILQDVVAKGLDASKVKMENIMSKPLITINEKMPVINAIRVMEKTRYGVYS